jgi:hypothetical protein
MEYGEEPLSAADSVQSPLEGDKGIVLKATWNKMEKEPDGCDSSLLMN